MIPSCSSCCKCCDSSAGDINGTPLRRSLKRVLPARNSRTIRSVQRSATISAAFAIGQNWPYRVMAGKLPQQPPNIDLESNWTPPRQENMLPGGFLMEEAMSIRSTTKNHPSDTWAAGEAYEAYVGRWSNPVAREFIPWLALKPNLRWVDVGCGTGALTRIILAAADPREVAGVDPSEGFIPHARSETDNSRANFQTGDVQHLPLEDGAFDADVSGWYWLRPSPGRPRRNGCVACPGGTVAVMFGTMPMACNRCVTSRRQPLRLIRRRDNWTRLASFCSAEHSPCVNHRMTPALNVPSCVSSMYLRVHGFR